MAATNGRGKGRPEVQIDFDVLRALASVGCTDAELAAHFRCSERTIASRRKEPAFLAEIDSGYALGNISLRRKQMTEALKGNTSMLIWLGKNRLGQKDKTELSGEVKITPPKIHVHFVKPAPKA